MAKGCYATDQRALTAGSGSVSGDSMVSDAAICTIEMDLVSRSFSIISDTQAHFR
jgi:hypothetical protein